MTVTALVIDFILEGRSPFLFHADDVLAADALEAWRKDPANKKQRKAGDDRSPPWTWHSYLYSDGTHVALPTENLMACLRNAGAQVIMQKQKTFKESTQSGLWTEAVFFDFLVNGEKVPISAIEALHDLPFAEQAEAVKDLGLTLFVKRAPIGRSKHVRVRPRAEEWSVRGSLEVFNHAPELTFEVLERIFGIAGRVGLGDWRPGCRTPGRFGMFQSILKRQ